MNGGGGNERRQRRYNVKSGTYKTYWYRGGGDLMDALVLRKNGKGWEEVGTTEARSYQDAVEALADKPGEYCAIPSTQVFTVGIVEKLAASLKTAG